MRPADATRGKTSREKILETSVMLFNQHGYDRTSVAEITGQLGITKAAIYYHFGSKEEILLAAIRSASEEIDAAISGAMGKDLPVKDACRSFLQAYESALGSPFFRCLIFSDERVLGIEGQAEVQACKTKNQRRLVGVLESGGIGQQEARSLALATFGALNWSAMALGDRFAHNARGISDSVILMLDAALEQHGATRL